MAEIRHATLRSPLLFGGISNQPPHIRQQNQVQDAQNASFSVVEGASKRPGTIFVAKATALPDLNDNSGEGGTPADTVSGLPATDITTDTIISGSGDASPTTAVPANYASTYSVSGFGANGTPVGATDIIAIVPPIVITQAAGRCTWAGFQTVAGTGTSAGYSLSMIICVTLDVVRTPTRWCLGVMLLMSNSTSPSMPVLQMKTSAIAHGPTFAWGVPTGSQSGTDLVTFNFTTGVTIA